MPVDDVVRIAVTSSVVQSLLCVLFQKLIYEKEGYQRACSQLERARIRRDKVTKQVEAAASAKSPTHAPVTKSKKSERERAKKAAEESNAQSKAVKKAQRADDEFNEAAARVASKHSLPKFFSSIVFLILGRILGTEYSGKVVAVLPFVPWRLVQKITHRGLGDDVDPRACSFYFIFILCSLSVKFLVGKFLETQVPKGVNGFSNFLDTPKAQKMLESYGLDAAEFNEARGKMS